MHIRIYWGKVMGDAWPDIEQRYKRLMEFPAPGLLARFVTQDVNDRESMFTVTFWQDAESIKAWEASDGYANLYLAAVSPFITGAMSVSLCEVKVFEAAALAAQLTNKDDKT
jgi:heme-degrading monooxygenase HmoA